ncbi:hypothetical protein [Pseudomonas sp. NPDC086251]|jgi:hypothetical protein|uniref:hypothetical protein n=1 Tax=Pseudomonas sp. NPDC086251 TaxID=3364431 RepID=UPI00383238C2
MHITQSIQPQASTFPQQSITPPLLRASEAEKKSDEEVYTNIHNQISTRYVAFDQDREIGYQNKAGLTGDIDSISKEDLVSILKHIKSDSHLLEQCRQSSAKSPLFTKLYLMSDGDQGWNLRLHTFSVKGSGLGGEDSPHFHRWTLASQVLAGGYINVNYEEGSIDQPHAKEHEYSKYELGASKAQSGKDSRQTSFISRATMTPTTKALYAEGATNHFPVKLAHSVETHASVMGTTLTLAHTGKSVTEKSYAFEKNEEIKEIPQSKIEDTTEFENILQSQITYLQVLSLSSDLNTLLRNQRSQDLPLTPKEENHVHDYHEPNYVETSLLPAIAIYQMESINNIPHEEFSIDTQAFLDNCLKGIDSDSLNALIVDNQGDLIDSRLTIEIKDAELSKQLKARAEDRIARSN